MTTDFLGREAIVVRLTIKIELNNVLKSNIVPALSNSRVHP